MRKLTVLLLSGAILAITGGVSVVRADGFAILQCVGPGPPHGFEVDVVNTSFDTPEECVRGNSCSKCAHAITESGNLKLADSNLSRPNLGQFQMRMIFAEKDKHKHRGRDKDED